MTKTRTIDQRAYALSQIHDWMLATLDKLSVLCLQDERYLHDAEFHHTTREARLIVDRCREAALQPLEGEASAP